MARYHTTMWLTNLFCPVCNGRLRETNLAGRIFCKRCWEYRDSKASSKV
jgi:hypothetical protein